MRLLITGARFPRKPLTDGYVLHLYHLVEELGRRHDVGLVTPDDGEGPVHPILDVEVIVLPSGARLAADLEGEVARFKPDVVHLVGARSRPLAEHVRRDLPSVLGALDAAHLNVGGGRRFDVLNQARNSAKRARITRQIRSDYHLFDAVVVVSDEDRTALIRENPRVDVEVVPNGVDLSAFASNPSIHRTPNLLMFTGALGYPPNVATATFLAREVVPRVRERAPDARLALVGRDPSPEVLALAAEPGVEVVGPVDDMGEALSRASIYLCPMVAGTGIKNKLLEAMANGLPAVASRLASRGLAVRDGREILIADSAEDVAGAALRLLAQPALRRSLGEAAQAYVDRHHTWEGMAEGYERIFERVIGSR